MCQAQERHPDTIDLDRAYTDSRSSIPFPLFLILPRDLVTGYNMRDYIASSDFGEFDSVVPPRVAFDDIYETAASYAHGREIGALLGAAFGSFDHERIPLHILGIHISVPLTSESRSRFQLRQSHLPAFLYGRKEPDRDKLQHFFANGWIKSVVGMDWLARLAGNFVEFGEDLMVVGGFEDPRDVHADQDGIRFAVEADGHPRALPSASLTPNP